MEKLHNNIICSEREREREGGGEGGGREWRKTDNDS